MEFVAAIVGAIATVTVENLIEPIGRQFGYEICYKRNINRLRDGVAKLKDDRDEVQLRVDEAVRKGEIILPNVQTWLREVHRIAVESEPFLNDETCQINKRCLNGLCPDLMWRYQIAKKAMKKTFSVDSLRRENKFENVSSPAPPPSIGSNFPGDFEVFESRKKAFDQIMKALKDDKVKVIGIYGMGGIGKTTFAKDVAKKAEEDKFFDHVVMAVVSQTPNTRQIQDEIAERLGFSLNDNTMSVRAGRLCQRLKQSKILVILDDLWKRVDLEVIGIPCSNIHKACKLLMTSRNRDVYDEMKADLYIPLEVLHPTEAWNFFRNMAGHDVDEPDLKPVATEVAKECAGLPLAIVTVAKALRRKGSYVWRDALLKLKNPTPRSFNEMNANVYSSLDLSYNSLGDKEMKHIFLLCCLFPEDSFIWIRDLVRYAMGLRLFDNVYTIKEAEDRVGTLVDGLKARCLLLGAAREVQFRVHDVIRDFCILVASTGDQREFLLTINAGVSDWSENGGTPISLMHNNIHKLPDRLDFPKLKLLSLYCHSESNPFKNPATFFEGMPELQVLHMLKTTLPTLPPSLLSLKNIRAFMFDSCKIGDISVLRELNSLEILVFRFTDTETYLPKEIGQLTSLRLLEFCFSCNKIEYIINAVGWIPSNGGFPVLEKLCLSSMMNLKEIWYGDLPTGSFSEVSELTLFNLPELINLWNDTTAGHACLHKLRFVKVQFCGKLKSVFSHHVARDLGQLRQLSIAHCNNLEEIFANDRERETVPVKDEIVLTNLEVFCLSELPKLNTLQPIFNKKVRVPNLMELKISDLNNLKEIWDNQLSAGSFNQLRVVNVRKCKNLLKVVPSNLLPRLQNLEELSVVNCDLVEEIVEVEEGLFDVKKDDYGNDMLLVLPQLRKLTVSNLPKLVEMWWNKDFHGTSLVCQNLSSLEIIRCDGLKNIPFLGPSISVKQFARLEELHITDCSTMKEVVAKGEEDQGEVLILFPRVHSLKLSNLSKLRGFYLGNLILEWPSLENVKVAGCPNMHTFSSMLPITPKLNAIESRGKLQWKGDLNRSIQHLFRVENWFTTIEERNDNLKLTEISEPSQCQSLKLPEDSRVTKISRLIYKNSGDGILALASNAIHLLWEWNIGEQNSSGQATTGVSPQLRDPSSGILMTNDVVDIIPEEAVPCFALSKYDILLSASGGTISQFATSNFTILETIRDPPPPPATFLAFHPRDESIVAIGMSDATILIYNFELHEFEKKLDGHSQRITGLTFSHDLNVLVSSGADAKLCVWNYDLEWEMQNSTLLQFSAARTSSTQSDTLVQFNGAQTEFLVVHETHLAIYEPTNLECVKQWVPCDTAASISHATFSCDGQLVYASFFDATVCVFNARNLLPGCRINASAYLSPNVSNSNVKPLVIAAHPIQRSQFALGLSDGRVYVIEPPHFEDCSTSNVTATPSGEASGLDQPQIQSNCCQSTSSFACFSFWPNSNLGQPSDT